MPAPTPLAAFIDAPGKEGQPGDPKRSEEAARAQYGFNGDAGAAPWAAWRAYDALMGSDASPDPLLGQAAADPLGDKARAIADAAFSTLPGFARDLARKRSHAFASTLMERSVALAGREIAAMGFSTSVADALLGAAFSRQALATFGEAFGSWSEGVWLAMMKDQSLGINNVADCHARARGALMDMARLRHPARWGSNAVVFEACLGDLGAAAHREWTEHDSRSPSAMQDSVSGDSFKRRPRAAVAA